MAGTKSRIILADDHEIVRYATRAVIKNIPEAEIIAEADNGISAITLVKTHKPNLLMLDAAMPMARGIEVFSEVRRWSPETQVCLLTGFTSAGLLSDWLEAGVDGILLKSCGTDEIQKAVEILLAGGQYISESVQDMLGEGSGALNLTAREREVLALIATGHQNAMIADKLCISAKTVEKHRGSLMRKLDVHSVAELMVYALREGLLDEHRQL